MERRSVEMIVTALNERQVRYLIVGGLAVVAHGYVRFTADIDLVIDLDDANLRRALAAFAELDYQPRAPVPLESFADPEARAEWVRDKGLTVFSLYSDDHRATEIDVFVELPFEFARAYAAASWMEVADGVRASFVGLADLINLKKRAGRPQDVDDIRQLETPTQ